MSRKPGEVIREGFGLHTGRFSRVILRRSAGPVAFVVGDRKVALSATRIAGTDRATTLQLEDGWRVSTVEHLLSALAGIGIQRGVSIEVEGHELPLLDGAARAYADALLELGVKGGEGPLLEVVCDAEILVGKSSYSFQRAFGVHVDVSIDFGDPRLEGKASWHGDADDYLARIAPSRTFAFARDLVHAAEQGGTAHVSPESVTVLAPDRVFSAGSPFVADEPARHKLLDLVGDLFIYGGPPRGAIDAKRPGHGPTHAAMREAIERRIVRPCAIVSSSYSR